MSITFVALITANVASAVVQYKFLQREFDNKLSKEIELIGQSISFALDFRDDPWAQLILDTAKRDPSIVLSCIYDKNEFLFASYQLGGYQCPAKSTNLAYQRNIHYVRDKGPVMIKDEQIGYVYIEYRLDKALLNFGIVQLFALCLLFLAMYIAYILARQMQFLVSGPITDLADKAEEITYFQEYDSEMPVKYNDETGRLIGAFNEMMRSIQVKEKDLINARKAAEKANRAKDLFLANMSHELRTPLNSIIGLVRILLQEDTIQKDHLETLSVVDKASASLLMIVNDILDISKIEAGKVELENIPFNPVGLFHSISLQIRPMAETKKLDFETNEKEVEDVTILGDEFRLTRIVLNLLSNAVKYTQKGKVSFTVSTQEIDASNVMLKLQVRDTGIGIPEDKIDTIFEKFTQAEDSTERRFGGTGLGLNITRQLVGLMGGRIDVESKVGEGSTFTVLIPFPIAATDDKGSHYAAVKEVAGLEKKAPHIHVQDARILVAEDHEFNQVFMIKLLKRLGCKDFHLAMNGVEAVKEFKKGSYDIIIMDCHMPEMNGYQATKEIRMYESEHDIKSGIPIIAMTADAMQGAREKCLNSGMNEYMTKPINEKKFRLMMGDWFILDGAPIKKSDGQNTVELSKTEEKDPADLSVLKEYAAGDVEMEEKLLGMFFKSSSEKIEILKENQQGGKNMIWSETAHVLKGSAAYIGAFKLVDLCAEAQAQKSASKGERERLFGAISHEYERVCRFLNDHLDEQ